MGLKLNKALMFEPIRYTRSQEGDSSSFSYGFTKSIIFGIYESRYKNIIWRKILGLSTVVNEVALPCQMRILRAVWLAH